MKVISLIAIALVLILVAFLLTTRNHWWREIPVKVFVDGKELPQSNVYVSRDGDFIVLLKESDEEIGLYLVHPKINKIGIESRSKFFKLPLYMYSRDYPVQSALSGTDKFARDPKLIIEPKHIEFVVSTDHKVSLEF
jgi:hypothetical protein